MISIQQGNRHKEHIKRQSKQNSQQQQQNQQITESIVEPKRKLSEIQSLLIQFYQSSKKTIDNDAEKKIEAWMKHLEQKTDAPKRYLQHMLSKSDADTQRKVEDLINQKGQMAMLFASQALLQPKKSLKQRQRQILNKLYDLNDGIKNLSQLQILKKRTVNQLDYTSMIYDKKYWDPKNEKSQEVKQFVKKISSQRKKIASKIRNRYTKSHEQAYMLDKLKKQQEEKIRQEKIKLDLERKLELKKLRQQQKNNKKFDDYNAKYFSKKPLFKHYQQESAKIAQQLQIDRKNKLSQIKDKYKPIDSQQLDEHEKKYEQIKNKHYQQQKLRQQKNQQEINQQIRQKLANLFHGRYHESIQQQQKLNLERKQKGKIAREKIQQYKNIIQQHIPKIDEKKRKEIQNIKVILQNKGRKRKKIISEDGSILFQQIPEVDGRKLGIQYLQSLRKMSHDHKTSRKIQKSEDNTKFSDITKKDYLRQALRGVKSTLSNWKTDMESQNLSKEQKYERVLKKTEVLDEKAKQYEMRLKYLKDKPDQHMQVKQSLDKHYLNSINAKLSVLSKLILN